MRIKYKVTLIFIAILIIMTTGVQINYQMYQNNNNDLSAFIKVQEGLSINYLNGKSIEVNKARKTIQFSITNQLNENLYYNISISKIDKDLNNVTYRLTSNNSKLPEVIDDFGQKSISSRIMIEPGVTHRYSLEIINNNMIDFVFELNVEAESVDNSFANSILNNNEIKESPITSFSVSSTENEGLIKETSEHGSIYYFRGNVNNNYVSFANNMWRIVKINEDKTVKLVLDKTTENLVTMNNPENIGNIDFLSSNLAQNLNSWYELYLKDYDDYIASTYYCFDNSVTSDELGNIDYLANIRLFTDFTPTNICSGINISSKIALLTADEVVMAGGSTAANESYYLHLPNLQGAWWTMTPNKKDNNKIYYIGINKDGSLLKDIAEDETAFLRPSITLSRKVISTGNGTIENPYTINWT